MLLIVFLQLGIVICIIRSSRLGIENSFPILCFFLVLMPLESKLVIPGICDINTMRVSLITITGLYLFRKENNDVRQIPLKNLIFVNIGWAIASTLCSLSVSTSSKQLLSQVFEYYLLYFIMVKSITKINTHYKILFSMMMAMGVCCLFAILEVQFHWSILRVFPQSNWITYNGGLDPLYTELGRGLRVRSTFPHPILFGDALAMSIPINLYLVQIWKIATQRRLLWANLALMLWAIYKTSSRGPWIALVGIGLLTFVFMKGRIRQYLTAVVIVTLVILLLRPGIWSTLEAMYQSTTDPSTPVGTSYLYRDALNEAVMKAVAQTPGRALLGYGLGTFRVLGLDIEFLGSTKHWYTCDNNWASFLYETGYIGLLLIVLLLFKVLFLLFSNYRRHKYPYNQLSVVIFISLLGFYFLMLSVAGYSWGQQGYMSWIMISIGISQFRMSSFKHGEHALNNTKNRLNSYDLNNAC